MKHRHIAFLLAFTFSIGAQAQSQRPDGISGATEIVQKKVPNALRRKKPSKAMQAAFAAYLHAIDSLNLTVHSAMVLQHGRVVAEQWMNGSSPAEEHVLNSVSKTFTSMAVGLAIEQGLLRLDDRVADFFPDKLPPSPSDKLRRITVRHLLTMNCGHDTDPTASVRNGEGDWIEGFLAYPVEHEPGTRFCYNSLGTYMLSAIVQKVTGETVLDYLTPRLFTPLGIEGMTWQQSPQGINCGGWGLYLKTEDLAKMGQLLLQRGRWKGRQLIPAHWIDEASREQVPCTPAGMKPADAERRGLNRQNSDWVQGYGYQMWRCRHNAFRADGAAGQYIVVLPDVDAVIVNTAQTGNMAKELELAWEYLLPALNKTR